MSKQALSKQAITKKQTPRSISQRFAGALFFGDIFLMTILALQPMHMQGSINHVDKVLHFLAYLVLAGLAFLFVRQIKPFLKCCVALVIYGGIIELLQSFMPGRYMSFADFVANIGGIAFAVMLVKIYLAQQAQSAIKQG